MLRECWTARELLSFLALRDVKIRYKQTFLGAAWAVIQPASTMLVMYVFFSRLAKVPSDGMPYPLFCYSALVCWTYFAAAVSGSATSLLGNTSLLTKVYFPRLCIPLAAVASPLVDLAVALLTLFAIVLLSGHAIPWQVVSLPLFLALLVAVAAGVGVLLASVTVRYRDFRFLVPFLMQLWMFGSPVAYASSLVPEAWRPLYGLNPLVTVLDGCRWAVLGGPFPDAVVVGAGLLTTVLLLALARTTFVRAEGLLADLL